MKLQRIKLKKNTVVEKGFSKQELSKMKQMSLTGGACGDAVYPADACPEKSRLEDFIDIYYLIKTKK